jgi:hypothetical protein
MVCSIEFMEWRYSQLCWYFRPSFVNFCPSNLLSGSPPHSQRTVYTDSVWLGGDGGEGVELFWRPYSARI